MLTACGRGIATLGVLIKATWNSDPPAAFVGVLEVLDAAAAQLLANERARKDGNYCQMLGSYSHPLLPQFDSAGSDSNRRSEADYATSRYDVRAHAHDTSLVHLSLLLCHSLSDAGLQVAAVGSPKAKFMTSTMGGRVHSKPVRAEISDMKAGQQASFIIDLKRRCAVSRLGLKAYATHTGSSTNSASAYSTKYQFTGTVTVDAFMEDPREHQSTTTRPERVVPKKVAWSLRNVRDANVPSNQSYKVRLPSHHWQTPKRLLGYSAPLLTRPSSGAGMSRWRCRCPRRCPSSAAP